MCLTQNDAIEAREDPHNFLFLEVFLLTQNMGPDDIPDIPLFFFFFTEIMKRKSWEYIFLVLSSLSIVMYIINFIIFMIVR